MNRLMWESTLIGDITLQNLQIAVDSNDRVFLRFLTKTKNDGIYNYVDEARQNVNGITFDYNDTDKDSEFVNDIMDTTCDTITRTFKSMRQNPQKTAHINSNLSSALEYMLKVVPKSLTITGYQNDIVITYELILNK